MTASAVLGHLPISPNSAWKKLPRVTQPTRVRWPAIGNAFHDAEVLRVRPAGNQTIDPPTTKTTAASTPEEFTQHLDYYVHFTQQDRRFDDWFPASAMQEEDLPRIVEAFMPSRKPERTKNQHDEMTLKDLLDVNHSLIGETTARRSRHQDELAAAADEKALELLHEEKEQTQVKYIRSVIYDNYEIPTWYHAPYPLEYQQKQLWICNRCFKYAVSRDRMALHQPRCTVLHPPGKEIYKHDTVSVWEIDGKAEKLYTQNISLFSKLFIDHKTLFFDMDPFMIYVVSIPQDGGRRHLPVAYYSKERVTAEQNNLACIITYPPWQRHGYGKLLIDISYSIGRATAKPGGPERPLSDLGMKSYVRYWKDYLSAILEDMTGVITLSDLCVASGMRYDDIVSILADMGALQRWNKEENTAIIPRHVFERAAHDHSQAAHALPPPAFSPPSAPPPSTDQPASEVSAESQVVPLTDAARVPSDMIMETSNDAPIPSVPASVAAGHVAHRQEEEEEEHRMSDITLSNERSEANERSTGASQPSLSDIKIDQDMSAFIPTENIPITAQIVTKSIAQEETHAQVPSLGEVVPLPPPTEAAPSSVATLEMAVDASTELETKTADEVSKDERGAHHDPEDSATTQMNGTLTSEKIEDVKDKATETAKEAPHVLNLNFFQYK